jgi:hypothetical protein
VNDQDLRDRLRPLRALESAALTAADLLAAVRNGLERASGLDGLPVRIREDAAELANEAEELRRRVAALALEADHRRVT